MIIKLKREFFKREHEKMGKGVTLTNEELEALKEILEKM